MSRQKTAAAEMTSHEVVAITPEESLANQQLVSAEQERQQRAATALSIDFEYSLARAMDALTAESKVLARSWMRMATVLTLVKENEPASVFQSVTDSLGISAAHAARFVSCAVKFRNRPEFHRIEKSKVLTLCGLDSDQLDEIQAGSVIGLDLDAIDRATNTELREMVRTLKADKATNDERLTKERSEKHALLDKLEQRDKDLQNKRRRTGAAYGDLTVAYQNLQSAITAFHAANEAVLLAAEEATPLSAVQENGVAEMFADLRDLNEKAGLGRTEDGSYAQ
jgi:hypothetical protein